MHDEERVLKEENSEATMEVQESKSLEEMKEELVESEKEALLKKKENMIHFRTIEKDKEGYNRFCKFCLHSKVSFLLNLA